MIEGNNSTSARGALNQASTVTVVGTDHISLLKEIYACFTQRALEEFKPMVLDCSFVIIRQLACI
ncbi:MAG: hypothetical protein HOI95_12255 [Chromatiales bacterium]|nr:hypothetical protein [Chromatiales bacterium]